ncbi:hypothetical protein J6590_064127 [Homalodisca vitripennis]|nr:hypothetical protein J6590_064127 [Homalodisca vitripennis]
MSHPKKSFKSVVKRLTSPRGSKAVEEPHTPDRSHAVNIDEPFSEATTSSPQPVNYRQPTQESSQRKGSLDRRSSKKDKRPKVPNVMRSSVVAPNMEVLPPFSALAPGESTHAKLSRVLEKFNSIVLTEELTPPPERKADTKTVNNAHIAEVTKQSKAVWDIRNSERYARNEVKKVKWQLSNSGEKQGLITTRISLSCIQRGVKYKKKNTEDAFLLGTKKVRIEVRQVESDSVNKEATDNDLHSVAVKAPPPPQAAQATPAPPAPPNNTATKLLILCSRLAGIADNGKQ